MERFSEKAYLSLKMPTEEVAVSDEKRIRLALESLGYEHVQIPLTTMRRLYPLCRDAGFDITVTLVRRDADWVVTDVGPGDTRQHHYGLAVDYGSTTIIMQLVDMNSGAVVGEEKCVNGQAEYGTDILTRITYALKDPTHMSRCYLSGAFTAHSNLEHAITIGIFPDLPREKYKVLKNTSLDGARCLLLDRSRMQDAKELSENIYCVQFASIPDFLVRMQAAKFIPHTDMSRYPSILQKLNHM